mmetsp:Transcript_4478/g.10165  ORF Transcript_4478/g.10165 Transcript_4478/m.10165 type:complete len:354 (-) Transcript_4478:143-1204(-)|eukprot:CAMPEP_0119377656 /NCGR_PEP_ID=MMETSP1334-20130426/46017_1 /TAXON_ID=127549 /ORGANISM="Calcidiscus leptoporus, Strain RCC1130" /LENGTH=353 /DNA_ID=CAMNT_0007396645 /DNA_START=151 /DNA_END=1212 /DNA_ORIENTATION=+
MGADLYCVTGGTGFVGSHCVKLLLRHGYKVRCTVRSPDSAKCDFLRALPRSENLTLVKADLIGSTEEEWRAIVRGCEVVMHTASPFQVENVPRGKEEDFFMLPAVRGTEVVIGACLKEGVRRVVLTSSVAAIAYGHAVDPKLLLPGPDDKVWTQVDGLALPQEMYVKSKTVAEQTAWKLIEGSTLELATVNPVLIMGPLLAKTGGDASQIIVRAMLKREYPAVPNVPLAVVDVRDVAKLHLICATDARAAGKRHLAVNTPHGQPAPMLPEIAAVLAHHFALKGYNVPKRKLPDTLVKCLACVDPKLKLVTPQLSKKSYTNPVNANALLGEQGWIPMETSIVDMAQSLIDLGKL